MARTWMLLVLAAAPLGCRDFDRPRDLRKQERPDLPQFSIEEQERRGRGRYPIIEDDFRVGPKTFADRPTPTGR